MNTTEAMTPRESYLRDRIGVKERQLTGLLLLKGTQHPETLRIRDEVMALENELEEIRQ